ncbi:Glucosamine 6-phosphate N-acetyltransferase 1 [Taenia crassiceps]|uniref:Glucosamine 6-phosphate N-acetyltransferase n=1 Tax=Taenia crassiceps TaxID=6207 RepID=A0ABR4Q889_9CEST
MSFVFQPSILQNLGLDATLLAKGITTATNPSGCQYLLRPLRSTDYGRFEELASLPSTYFIVVLEYLPLRKLIGCATLLVELKMIHGCSKDVVIDEAYRNKGLGRLLVSVLIEVGRSQGCYKISLDCDSDKVTFYERNGFKQETVSMCIRLSH